MCSSDLGLALRVESVERRFQRGTEALESLVRQTTVFSSGHVHRHVRLFGTFCQKMLLPQFPTIFITPPWTGALPPRPARGSIRTVSMTTPIGEPSKTIAALHAHEVRTYGFSRENAVAFQHRPEP